MTLLSTALIFTVLCWCRGSTEVSQTCVITNHKEVAETDVVHIDLSFPLLVTPPVKKVTYYAISNESLPPPLANLLSLASVVTMKVSFLNGTAPSYTESTLLSLYQFCSEQHTRSVQHAPLTEDTDTGARADADAGTERWNGFHTIHVHFTAEADIEHSLEEYSMDVTNQTTATITITTPSHKGLLHALSTLQQLLSSPVPLQLPVFIQDYPQYPYRGIMVDVARHFIPLPVLLRTIDAMAMCKLSVLHLHLTDGSSFPVLLRDTPFYSLSLLATLGSHPTGGGAKKHYTTEDLKRLEQHASQKGIEIIPEIDMPSHTLSWGKAIPGIMCNCSKYASQQENSLNIYTLDPTHPSTLPVIREVLKQVADIFPSRFFHVGGDEVDTECWAEGLNRPRNDMENKSDPIEVKKSLDSLLHDFLLDIFIIVKSLGKIPIMWQDPVDQGVFPFRPRTSSGTDTDLWWDGGGCDEKYKSVREFRTNSAYSLSALDSQSPLTSAPAGSFSHFFSHSPSSWALVEAWKCWQGLAAKAGRVAMDEGLDVITSACWYLDFDSDYDDFINAKPLKALKKMATNNHQSRVLGGEGALWTENVDWHNFECRLWPRGGVMAERLWGEHVERRDFSGISVSVNLDPAELMWSRGEKNSDAVVVNENTQQRAARLRYIRFRHFLFGMEVNAADISLHILDESRSSLLKTKRLTAKYTTLKGVSENDYLRYWLRLEAMTEVGVGAKIVSQCLGIPESIQRPVRREKTMGSAAFTSAATSAPEENTHKGMFLNIAEGAHDPPRRLLLLQWLREQANAGVTFIGMSELNRWDEIDNRSDEKHNFSRLRRIAAECGFSYSHVMQTSQPYNIGIVSSLSFEVVAEFSPPLFQRGLLHVFFRSLSLHVFVCHLHAHSSEKREQEVKVLVSLLRPVFDQDDMKVVVMGDMNTMHHYIADQQSHVVWADFLRNNSKSPTTVPSPSTADGITNRLRKKFCHEGTVDINYNPSLVLANTVLKDSCLEYCTDRQDGGDAVCDGGVDKCYEELCSYTAPTLFNPEWADIKRYPTMPRLRLDFIFYYFPPSYTHRITAAGVVDNNMTSLLSDHFPVSFSWNE